MTKNVAASIHQRLINHASKHGLRFNEALQRFALERWLYRMSISLHAECFVLKGALMLTAWGLPMSRPTKDIDLLARTSNDLEFIKSMIIEIGSTPLDNDGLNFLADTVTCERIAEDAHYEGVRSTFRGQLGNARISIQIDMGSAISSPQAPSISSIRHS